MYSKEVTFILTILAFSFFTQLIVGIFIIITHVSNEAWRRLEGKECQAKD